MQLQKLLRPFSLLFGLIVRIRARMFAWGWLKRYRVPLPTVVVGNLSVGGSGKTPMIVLLAEAFIQKGMHPVVLSRGYGRNTKGFREVGTDSSPLEVGDEPLMIKQLLPNMPVFVCEDRVRGVREIAAIEGIKAELVLLDDAFQHLRLKADFYLLLSDWNKPFFVDYLMPEGRLREPRKAAKRAHALVFTKIPATLSDRAIKKQHLKTKKYTQHIPIFLAYPRIKCLHAFANQKQILLQDMSSQRVLLLSAIANPADYERMMSQFGQVVGHEVFRDHAFIKEEVLHSVNRKAVRKKAIVVTTHKDFARLQPLIAAQPNGFASWYYVDYRFEMESLDALLDKITQRLSKFVAP